MKASKKLLSLLLVVMLLVSAIPFQVFAAPVDVPVTVVEEDGSHVEDKTLNVPDEGVTLNKELGDSLLGASSEYETVCWRSASSGNDLPLTEPLTNATASAAGYSINLVVRRKEVVPTTPTTYTATLKATLDGAEVGSSSQSGITEIELTENLAKSLYSGFDASRHVFKGWSGGLSGKQTLTADTTYTAVFETIPAPAPTYTATLKATLDGHEVGSSSRSGITEIELTENLAKSLYSGFDASRHVFKGWSGGLSGKQTLTADATFTAVFETIKPTGYKASIYVYVNGTINLPVYEKTGVTSLTLNKDLYEEIVNAKKLGQVDEFTYTFYEGNATSGTAVTNATYTLSADAVYTVVLTTKTADPVKKDVTFIVDGKQYAVTECTEGQKPSVPEDPYKANYTFRGWYSAENGQGTRLVSGQNWNNSMPTTYYAYFTSNLNPKYDTIRVFVKRYVGNVLKGTEELTIENNKILRGESVLNWLNSKKDEIDGLVEDKYDGVYTWNPKYFYDNDSNAKLTSQDLVTNGNKSVFIKVNAPQIKVQLYIHKDKVTASPNIKDMDGYRIGDTVTKTAVDTIVKKYYSGSKMVIQGLYTEADWAALKAGNKPTASGDLTVTEDGMEIHVLVTNATASTADPSNPKTGDYILDTAVALMVISGLAAAAVYVVGKKRRV